MNQVSELSRPRAFASKRTSSASRVRLASRSQHKTRPSGDYRAKLRACCVLCVCVGRRDKTHVRRGRRSWKHIVPPTPRRATQQAQARHCTADCAQARLPLRASAARANVLPRPTEYAAKGSLHCSTAIRSPAMTDSGDLRGSDSSIEVASQLSEAVSWCEPPTLRTNRRARVCGAVLFG